MTSHALGTEYTAESASDLRALTEIADQRLYAAKRAGRDRVVA